MSVITEIFLRQQFKDGLPKEYFIAKGTVLSPSAKEYLAHKKVKVIYGEPSVESSKVSEVSEEPQIQYRDYESGAIYFEKPIYMTELVDNQLVFKHHPRIALRAQLDGFQASVMMAQVEIGEKTKNQKLLVAIQEVVEIIGVIRDAECFEKVLEPVSFMHLTHEEIRQRIHNPELYFKRKTSTSCKNQKGYSYAKLNELRSKTRELEVCAVLALDCRRDIWAQKIISQINSLTHIFELLMLMELMHDQ